MAIDLPPAPANCGNVRRLPTGCWDRRLFIRIPSGAVHAETSFLAERHGPDGMTRILVDTSPDLREQLLDAGVEWVDAVLFTHEHADHTHGIDDLRGLFMHRRKRVPVWLDERVSQIMHGRFGYCFASPPGSEYPPDRAGAPHGG